MKDILDLEDERLEWSLKTFKNATPISSLYKLRSEINEVIELLEAKERGEPVKTTDLIMEYADCQMCLNDSIGRAGIKLQRVHEAFEVKLTINKARDWQMNPDKSYSHVKKPS